MDLCNHAALVVNNSRIQFFYKWFNVLLSIVYIINFENCFHPVFPAKSFPVLPQFNRQLQSQKVNNNYNSKFRWLKYITPCRPKHRTCPSKACPIEKKKLWNSPTSDKFWVLPSTNTSAPISLASSSFLSTISVAILKQSNNKTTEVGCR